MVHYNRRREIPSSILEKSAYLIFPNTPCIFSISNICLHISLYLNCSWYKFYTLFKVLIFKSHNDLSNLTMLYLSLLSIFLMSNNHWFVMMTFVFSSYTVNKEEVKPESLSPFFLIIGMLWYWEGVAYQ